MEKKALITGITGQDGSYLAELLLEKGYEVHGLVRRTSITERPRIDHLFDKIQRHYGDLTDYFSIKEIVKGVLPDEIYNLGAQSHVGISYSQPAYTRNVIAGGTARILSAVKKLNLKSKIYQASSSDMFGKTKEMPQRESTPFNPKSPYAEARVEAFEITQDFRKNHKLFICNGIAYNHESPRRGENFVTRKITRSLAEIELGLRKNFQLGNLESKRDWGYAKDYVEAMWLMLQQNEPDDYVLATGETHSVREFVEESAKVLDIKIKWKGEGVNEKGYSQGKEIISINPKFYRLIETNRLVGDASKAKEKLDWVPKINFKELVRMMVEADYERLQK